MKRDGKRMRGKKRKREKKTYDSCVGVEETGRKRQERKQKGKKTDYQTLKQRKYLEKQRKGGKERNKRKKVITSVTI